MRIAGLQRQYVAHAMAGNTVHNNKGSEVSGKKRENIQSQLPGLFGSIYRLVRQVPPGRVTTYGSIGRHVGCTGRTVGFAMAALPSGLDVPWQRVINSQGKVSPRRNNDGDVIQRQLLEAEGVFFDSLGRVDLVRYGWEHGMAELASRP